MRAHKLAARDGRTHRKLSGEQRGANDLGEFGGLAATRTAENLQTLATGSQRSATTDSRDGQRRQRHTRIKISVWVQLEIRYADRCVGYVRDVLTASDEDSREAVSQLAVVTDSVSLQVTQHRVLPDLQ